MPSPSWSIGTLQANIEQQIYALQERLQERSAAHEAMHDALEARLIEAHTAHIRSHEAAHNAMEAKIETAFSTHAHEHVLLKETREIQERSLKESTELAARQAELWRINANEWRGAMSDRERTLMTRSLADQQFTTLNEKIQDTYERIDHMFIPIRKDIEALKLAESHSKGSQAMAVSIFAGLLAIMGLIMTVLQVWKPHLP